ncbi:MULTISPECIES: RagB/SusD family nutrient uptake outer membrane protein [Sphingobacterium]|uniref:RagB/SusD family nutrient uptake outer membrane protein n=1 Tax=Sphingobacterium TaxID=28453 RepID=UPI00257C56E6|nr:MULTISPECIES: RagB/SusD family nutrient uptake outer membrane protein [Sphingobacterium]
MADHTRSNRNRESCLLSQNVKIDRSASCQAFLRYVFSGDGEYDLDRDSKLDLVIYEGTAPVKKPGVQYQKLGELVLEKGKSGDRIVNLPDILKKWTEEKDYYYPIPRQELQLNPKLEQHKGWDKSGT